MTTEIETPVGRIVWGHPGKSQIKKDQQTKQPVLKDGKPVEQWVFGVAFSRAEFEQKIWPAMQAEISSGYPQGFPSNFSFKYKDGNANDRNGKPYSAREGYAGCYVLTVSTEAFAPPVYKFDGRQYQQMQPDQYKCGDYVVLKLNLKVNVPTNRSHTPGLFVNPVGILHVGFGQEIVTTGGDPTEMFGAQPQNYALPAGASATPIAPNPSVGMPGQQPMAPNPGYQPMQPQPGYQQPGMAQQPHPGHVQPAHDFVQNAGYQQPGNGAGPGMYPSQNPAGMPGNGGPYPSNNGPTAQPTAYHSNPGQPQQPAPAQYYQPPGPGMPSQQMPGMMPPNR